MVRVQPKGLGNYLFQLELNLEDVLARREAGPVAHAEDVRVDREGFLAECGVENHVCRLASDSGQLFQLLAGARHLAPMVADQVFRKRNHVLRLGVEQTDRLDRSPQPLLA